MVYQLNYISIEDVPGMSFEEKTQLFIETRQAYGRSALLLSGGGGLGIHHFGVLRCLHEHHLLPRILSGSSVGSLVGVTPEDELDLLLAGETPALKNTFVTVVKIVSFGVGLTSIFRYLLTREGESATLWSKMQHFFK